MMMISLSNAHFVVPPSSTTPNCNNFLTVSLTILPAGLLNPKFSTTDYWALPSTDTLSIVPLFGIIVVN